MLVSSDLLDTIETADKIMEKICENHKKGEDTQEETKIFNYLHGIIAKADYDLKEIIKKYIDQKNITEGGIY